MTGIEIGERFSFLVVMAIGEAFKGRRPVLVACDCGRVTIAVARRLLDGRNRSCGSYAHRQKHGESRAGRAGRTAENVAWQSMKRRCASMDPHFYANYGGRGITVCDRWRDSFTAFLADMGRRPSAKHSIDRIDDDGNYEPGNCRWALQAQQVRNTRVNRLTEHDVVDVRTLHAFGARTRDLADSFRVSRRTINSVVAGETWFAVEAGV